MHSHLVLNAFRGRQAERDRLLDECVMLHFMLGELWVANPLQVAFLSLEMNLRVVEHVRQHFVECSGRSNAAFCMAVSQTVDQFNQLLVLIIQRLIADAVRVFPDQFFEKRFGSCRVWRARSHDPSQFVAHLANRSLQLCQQQLV